MAILILAVVLQVCTEAVGTNEGRNTKGSFTPYGEEYQGVASSAKTDPSQKRLDGKNPWTNARK